MLSKRRCPHTGVINFFFDVEPHIAVGSLVKRGRHDFLWWCHAQPCECAGMTSDKELAERRIFELCLRASSAPLVEAA